MHALKILLRRLALVLAMMTVVRLIFWWANQNAFPHSGFLEKVLACAHGLRFDLSSLFWINAPLILFSLLPGFWRKKHGFNRFLRWLWLLPNVAMLTLELADIAWFPFNLRRTILSDFWLLGETKSQIPTFFLENKSLVGVLLVFGGALFLFSKQHRSEVPTNQTIVNRKSKFQNWIIFLFSLPIWLLVVRGGWQMRPISPIMAAQFVDDPREAPILANATMNILASAQQNLLAEKNWFPEKTLDSLFSLQQNLGNAPGGFRKLNVVTIALEGAGTAYLEAGWMPFLDSLKRVSFSPKIAYANGMRSVQGNTAIVAGIPALMNDPWPFSAYQNDLVDGLALILRQKGYETAFFHGSDPGSMQLDKLAATAGFQKMFDRTAFKDQSLYDGRWGIFDRPFFEFFCEKLHETKPPFYAHFFSMTSHAPFLVEPFFEKQFPNMPKVERSFRYTDASLRQFFEKASREDWFKNTLFVISADHTGPEREGKYTGLEGKFRIPILFYQAGVTDFFQKNAPQTAPDDRQFVADLAQQVDILPSVLDWLDYSDTIHCFGRSVFQKNVPEPRVAYVEESGVFQIMDGRYLLTFDGQKVLQLFDYQEDAYCSKDILNEKKAIAAELEVRLKAIIQRHNRAMIFNQLR